MGVGLMTWYAYRLGAVERSTTHEEEEDIGVISGSGALSNSKNTSNRASSRICWDSFVSCEFQNCFPKVPVRVIIFSYALQLSCCFNCSISTANCISSVQS